MCFIRKGISNYETLHLMCFSFFCEVKNLELYYIRRKSFKEVKVRLRVRDRVGLSSESAAYQERTGGKERGRHVLDLH